MDKNRLFELVHQELHVLAGRFMRRERPEHTLQPTALVNEVYLKLRNLPETRDLSRAEFLGVAFNAMGQVLKDHARRRNAQKRQHERVHLTVGSLLGESDLSLDRAVALVEALGILDRDEPNGERQANLVRYVWFQGHTYKEAAELLGISARQAKRDWAWARARLAEILGDV